MSNLLITHDRFLEGLIKADGCRLTDERGRTWLDLESGIWAAGLGHNHPRINRVIRDMLERVSHLNTRYLNPWAEKAAGRLLTLTGLSGGRCLFLSSGSEAVELGVTLAREATGRAGMLTFANSYLCAFGSAGQKPSTDWTLLDPIRSAACPGPTACSEDCRSIAALDFDRTAGFVLEPGSSSGTVDFPERKVVECLADRVKKAGGLVVANEITTGIGRTGEWFGYEHYPVRPDVVALGKGLGNGYPVSAVVVSPEIAERVTANHFHYAQSHQNDPLGCAIAAEVMAVIEEDGLLTRTTKVGDWLLSEIREITAGRGSISQVRGRGLHLGIQFKEPDEAIRVHGLLMDRRLLPGLQPQAGVIRLLPALTITREELSLFLTGLEASL